MVGVDIPVSAIQAFEPRRALGPSGYTFAVNQVSDNYKKLSIRVQFASQVPEMLCGMERVHALRLRLQTDASARQVKFAHTCGVGLGGRPSGLTDKPSHVAVVSSRPTLSLPSFHSFFARVDYQLQP